MVSIKEVKVLYDWKMLPLLFLCVLEILEDVCRQKRKEASFAKERFVR